MTLGANLEKISKFVLQQEFFCQFGVSQIGTIILKVGTTTFFIKLSGKRPKFFFLLPFFFSFDHFRYLSCVSQTMKKLQPFGDVPRKLTEQLRRSFVASRTFAQALLEGKQIINKISKVRTPIVKKKFANLRLQNIVWKFEDFSVT